MPSHLRGAFPDLVNPKTHRFKRELVRSLATKELKEAKRRDHQAALKATQLFDAAVKALVPPTVAVQPVALDLKQLADDVFAGLLADDEAERMEGDDRRHLQTPEERAQWPDLVAVPPATQMGMSPDHAHVYGECCQCLKTTFAQHMPGAIQDRLPGDQHRAEKRGIYLSKSSPEFQKAALVVLEAHVRAYEAMGKRQRGDIIPTPVMARQSANELGPRALRGTGVMGCRWFGA